MDVVCEKACFGTAVYQEKAEVETFRGFNLETCECDIDTDIITRRSTRLLPRRDSICDKLTLTGDDLGDLTTDEVKAQCVTKTQRDYHKFNHLTS